MYGRKRSSEGTSRRAPLSTSHRPRSRGTTRPRSARQDVPPVSSPREVANSLVEPPSLLETSQTSHGSAVHGRPASRTQRSQRSGRASSAYRRRPQSAGTRRQTETGHRRSRPSSARDRPHSVVGERRDNSMPAVKAHPKE
ncbi:hypothetical protein KIPB_012186, partial [Kipferlia bialata]|eukprot:g12186.t1